MSTNFEIQSTGAFSVDIGVGIIGMNFTIYDPQRDEFAMYQLKGVAIGIGTPSLTPGSGPFTSFTTPKPMTVADFWGPAKVASGGGGSVSYVSVEFNPLGCPPFDVSVSTAFTWGADLWSISAGVMGTMFPRTSGKPPGYEPPSGGSGGPPGM